MKIISSLQPQCLHVLATIQHYFSTFDYAEDLFQLNILWRRLFKRPLPPPIPTLLDSGIENHVIRLSQIQNAIAPLAYRQLPAPQAWQNRESSYWSVQQRGQRLRRTDGGAGSGSGAFADSGGPPDGPGLVSPPLERDGEP